MPRDLRTPAALIVHGAWADATSWREVIAILQAKGMLAPALQRETAARINARVHTLRAGHLPFLSKPNETAAVILAAVDGVRREWPRR